MDNIDSEKAEIFIQLNKLPDILECPVQMNKPNEPISIYEGSFRLKNDDNNIELKGKVLFEWIPNYRIRFFGIVDDPSIQFLNLFDSSKSKPYKLFINNQEFGACRLSMRTFRFGEDSELKVEGEIINQNKIGDFSIDVDKIIFAIPNLRDFHGHSVKYVDDNFLKTKNCRLVLENKNFTICLDTCKNINNVKDVLREEGGYIITHSGELKHLRGKITFNEGNKLLNCLSAFLTFINGRRTATIFRKGVLNDQIIFNDNTPYSADEYKAVNSWPPQFSIVGLSQAWENFSELWEDEDYEELFTTAIHWYVEANALTAYTEGSIILAQTALELIYNFLIVEDKKIITGKDSQAITASNKIRLLLSQLSVTSGIPPAFKNLLSLSKSNTEINDGPEAIVQIRNAIVHSHETKRRRLSKISLNTRYEALQMSIWYIELSLLFIIKYEGKYFNRTSGAIWSGDGEELVPWGKEVSLQI